MKNLFLWLVLLGSLLGFLVKYFVNSTPMEPLRVGVLHALTGEMSVSETALVDAVRLAAEEINAQGGLLGRQLELVVVDTQSDDSRLADETERLFIQEHVSVLFGCWTSSCRKAVKPIVERLDQLMFYPVRYEGMEESQNIIYTGAVPNQQLVPGTSWGMKQFGKRVSLIGSNHLFSQTSNLILRDLITMSGGEILAEHTLDTNSLNDTQWIEDIKLHKPHIILNTLVGKLNALFFLALEQNGLTDLPVVSFGVGEGELQAWGGTRLSQHYGVWSYFQSLPDESNRRFVAAFKARFGNDRVTSAPIEAAYVSVHLWANAVRNEDSLDPKRLKYSISRQSVPSPSGIASLDSISHHLWKMVRVGHVKPDGQFEQVFASQGPVRPFPWLINHSRQEWKAMIAAMEQRRQP